MTAKTLFKAIKKRLASVRARRGSTVRRCRLKSRLRRRISAAFCFCAKTAKSATTSSARLPFAKSKNPRRTSASAWSAPRPTAACLTPIRISTRCILSKPKAAARIGKPAARLQGNMMSLSIPPYWCATAIWF